MKTNAVVLAAGKSSRMGTNKLLLELDSVTVLEHILTNLKSIPVIVVTGYRPEDIEAFAESFGAKTVHNSDYEKGMATSFQAGLRAVPEDIGAVYLVLSDTFGFKPSLLDELAQVMENDSNVLLVSPMHEGKRGHPVLVSRKLFPEFLNVGEGETMKDIVLRHEQDHQYVEGDMWTGIDLDTPDDYARAKKLWALR
ncbi:nucleotidyltransferase family protein [Candidatus Bathyarchaeota archaeon]|nr:MAG: nucleotidyltransferase family protein [Candidatus Bathyarchaeota archaeon]